MVCKDRERWALTQSRPQAVSRDHRLRKPISHGREVGDAEDGPITRVCAVEAGRRQPRGRYVRNLLGHRGAFTLRVGDLRIDTEHLIAKRPIEARIRCGGCGGNPPVRPCRRSTVLCGGENIQCTVTHLDRHPEQVALLLLGQSPTSIPVRSATSRVQGRVGN